MVKQHTSYLFWLTLCVCINEEMWFLYFILLLEFLPTEPNQRCIIASFIFSSSSLCYLAGPVSNRLEPASLSDAGDVSPVTLIGGLPVVEPLSPSDTALEESLERDRWGQGLCAKREKEYFNVQWL